MAKLVYAAQGRFLRDVCCRPGIVVDVPGVSPVAIETELEPARAVKADARECLGRVVTESGRTIEHTIAMRVPPAFCGDHGALRGDVESARFRYCAVSGTPARNARWPAAGWLEGGIDDVARPVETLALSEEVVAHALNVLAHGVKACAEVIHADTAAGFTDAPAKIAKVLYLRGGDRTVKMGMVILANALNFCNAIAGVHGMPPLHQLRRPPNTVSKSQFLTQWQQSAIRRPL